MIGSELEKDARKRLDELMSEFVLGWDLPNSFIIQMLAEQIVNISPYVVKAESDLYKLQCIVEEEDE